MKLFKDKPILLLATSPGARGGINVMESAKNIFPYFGGNIQSSYVLTSLQEHFSNGYIHNTEHQVDFEKAVETFKEALV